jgi:sugar-specific transcriptional regulator TrmB
MDHDLVQLLQELGLTTNEALVYLTCLELGRCTVQQIAERAKIKRTSIYNFIDRLLENGYLLREKSGGRHFYLACSSQRILEKAKRQVQICETLLPQIEQISPLSFASKITHYRGPKQMLQILEEELLCKKEVLYIWPGAVTLDAMENRAKVTQLDRERCKRGIKVRSIRFQGREHSVNQYDIGRHNLKEVRYAPKHLSSHMGLVIYDTGKVGFFSSKQESFAMIVESAELAAQQRMLFELVWSTSKVVPY